MEIRKLAPWNWFRDEERDAGEHMPVAHAEPAWEPLADLRREIDRVFENAWRGFGALAPGERLGQAGTALLKPSVDISATGQAYSITVEIPGVKEDDIELELAKDRLIIRGEKRYEAERDDKQVVRLERAYGSFQRILTLPEDADPEQIEARFEDGVLLITLPRKAMEKRKGRVIGIKSAA